MSILSSNYKKENNIDSSNILSLFNSIEEDSVFISKKMYYEKINNNITKYYVYGLVEKNQIIDDALTVDNQYTNQYFIVYLDTINKTFAVEPYDGSIFIGGENNE